MCFRGSPPPVFLDPQGAETGFLDDLLGWSRADGLRSLLDYPRLHDPDPNSPYGMSSCVSDISYLTSAFSSLWAIALVPLAFVAGTMLFARKDIALTLLGAGLTVSLIDTGIRATRYHGRLTGELPDLMIEALPFQLGANLLFQLALPFAAGLLLARLLGAMRGLVPRMS